MAVNSYNSNEIRRILLASWDPIAIRQEPRAQDEYDAYIDRIAKECLRGSKARIVATLLSIERYDMELSGDEARANRVADQLLEIV